MLFYRLQSGRYSQGDRRELHLHWGRAFSIIHDHIQHLQQHSMYNHNNIPLSVSEIDYISLWRPLWTHVCLQASAQISLPDSAAVDTGSSTCGINGSLPWLVAVFGPGHALGLSFSTNGSVYSVANLTLQYNLSDTSVFPGANSSGEFKWRIAATAKSRAQFR